MVNTHLVKRLEGIHTILKGVHQAGQPMSSASKGSEREAFVNQFLATTFPPPYRFGTGDATGTDSSRSGQLDVVMEYPFLPSLPLPVANARLYLAESIAAVVEIKSNLSSQLDEAVATSDKLSNVKRDFGSMMMTIGPRPTERIPMFLVGYTGWTQIKTVQKHVESNPNIDGILIIDAGLFVSGEQFYGLNAQGPMALWGLICCLHQAATTLMQSGAHPLNYARGAT